MLLLPVTLGAPRRVASLLPASAAVAFVVALALLPFNSAAFVVQTWTALLIPAGGAEGEAAARRADRRRDLTERPGARAVATADLGAADCRAGRARLL